MESGAFDMAHSGDGPETAALLTRLADHHARPATRAPDRSAGVVSWVSDTD
ncbi:MAG TPA: hypothetical protein VGL93_11885 [Streptosporangiaceae bacterium]|jgi:hypothetical protein